jgi:hypothetical protein
MIKPTVGRVVLFHPENDVPSGNFAPAPICAGIVAHVWSDTCVNLAVFDRDGVPHSYTSVLLVQDGDALPDNGRYAEWMPYQKGQAEKAESLESALSKKLEPLLEAAIQVALARAFK